jgi:hypothetical protein
VCSSGFDLDLGEHGTSVSGLIAAGMSSSAEGASMAISSARAWITTPNSDRVSRTFAANRLI